MSQSRITPPSPDVHAQAAARLAALATPPGALGRLGELGPGSPQPRVRSAAAGGADRLVIFAGDHGVAAHGASAFPPAITGAMVRTFLAGKAGVSALPPRTASPYGRSTSALTRTSPTSPPTSPGPDRAQGPPFQWSHPPDRRAHRRGDRAGARRRRDRRPRGDRRRGTAADQRRHGNWQHHPRRRHGRRRARAARRRGRRPGHRSRRRRAAHKTKVIDAALARAGERTDDPVQTLAALGSADVPPPPATCSPPRGPACRCCSTG